MQLHSTGQDQHIRSSAYISPYVVLGSAASFPGTFALPPTHQDCGCFYLEGKELSSEKRASRLHLHGRVFLQHMLLDALFFSSFLPMHCILSFLALSPLTGFSTSYLDDRKYVAFQTYDVKCFIKNKIMCLKYFRTAVIKKVNILCLII